MLFDLTAVRLYVVMRPFSVFREALDFISTVTTMLSQKHNHSKNGKNVKQQLDGFWDMLSQQSWVFDGDSTAGQTKTMGSS